MSLGLGLFDSDVNRGWRDTVFSRDRENVEPLSRNGNILDLQSGPSLAGHLGSDIGSVSQPLEATKACFK